MNRAVIDIGTNTVKLLVARAGPRGAWSDLRELVVPARLGEGLAGNGNLRPRAMRRTIDAMRRFLALCRKHRVSSVTAVATAVLRDARNSRAFRRLCLRLLALPIRVMSGREEAEIACRGAASGMLRRSALFIDIGGGSTEIVRMKNRKITARRSLPIGAVHLSTRFLRTDPPRPKEIESMTREIERILRVPAHSPPRLVAVGGTGATLFMVARRMRDYDPRRIHGRSLRRSEIERLFRRMSAMTIRQREAMTGMEPGRADIIIAGTAILLNVMERLDLPSVTVSARGLRHGLLLA